MAKYLLSHLGISFILSAIILLVVVKIKKNGVPYNMVHASASKAGRLIRFLLLDLALGILISVLLLLAGVLYDSIAEPIRIDNSRAAMASIQDNLEQYWATGADAGKSEAASKTPPPEQSIGASAGIGKDGVPKVLIISKNDTIEDVCHIDDLQFELPKEMTPTADADMDYIAKVSWFFMRYGKFSNGDTASSTCAHITIVDASNNHVIAQNDIYGDEPNVTRRAGASGSVVGPVPAEKIIHYIRQTILMLLFEAG